MDCFVAYAPRNDEESYLVCFSSWSQRVNISRRPGQAKREPGPIATNVDFAKSWSASQV
jgi:hypothetical protein